MIQTEIELLKTPIQFVKGVGPKLASLLNKIGLSTLEDLLYHIPFRYIDRRTLTSIREAHIQSECVIKAELMGFSESSIGRTRRKIFEAIFKDETGYLQTKWFNYYSSSLKKNFKKGRKAILAGKIDLYRGQKQIVHPDIEWIDEDEEVSDSSSKIISIYSLTEGLHLKTLSKIVRQALLKAIHLTDPIPTEILNKFHLMSYADALKLLHEPRSDSDLGSFNEQRSPAHKRLIFDEFFFLEMGLALKKRGFTQEESQKFFFTTDELKVFFHTLPFQPTQAQQRAIADVLDDLKLGKPMHRLLQGDVGSGKTLVAAAVSWLLISKQKQVCLMAPTEVLAEQHFKNFKQFLSSFDDSVALLKGDLATSEKKKILESIAEGKIKMVIGTHAAIQEEVRFHDLALAIVDEQHRFGVLQRAELKKKGNNPHLLIMTATPIPRTLSLTVYGDLEVSILDELPAGRQSIFTRIVYEKELSKLYQFIRQEIGKGRQAYVVYPLVEESEKLDLKNATQMFQHLQNEIFPDLHLGLLHGQMKSDEKSKILQNFLQNEIQILISTTVVEVGVDVPNATIMVIEHAERFGLSQLHQMRGRVGRGAHKSYCFLSVSWPQSELAKQRLKMMCETQDGFKIAEADLQIRGPGDFLGTRQSGLPDFRIANLLRDQKILEAARQEAFAWIEKDPELNLPESQVMKQILIHRWEGRLNLSQIG